MHACILIISNKDDIVRALASGKVKGLPKQAQVLHVVGFFQRSRVLQVYCKHLLRAFNSQSSCRGGSVVKDVLLEQINVSNGGQSLIEDGELMLAYGRRYGLVGRNGTGKTTFLRAFASGEIKGLPKQAQVLHVEQEVVGDSTPVLEVRAYLSAAMHEMRRQLSSLSACLSDEQTIPDHVY
jgi:ABC-type glutathione transport system ATPase component